MCDFKTAKIGAVKPVVGEAEAAKMGVHLAIQHGFRNIILEGDSELVTAALQHHPQITNWKIQPLMVDIHSSFRQMHAW